MKIIFLDFDGVIVTRKYRCRRGDEDCIQQLNNLTDATNAKIVVSSCWRINTPVEELATLLASWGVTGEVIDKTPLNWDLIRGQEIKLWMDEQSQEFDFVILDDDSDMGDLMPYLVKTKFETGLTADLVVKAKQILEG